MKKVFSFFRNRHQDIFRVILILTAILLITNRYPKHGVFKYDFSLGKPWAYKDLTAPGSFPIQKSTEELEIEKKELQEGIDPYFEIKEHLEADAMERFIDDFETRYRSIDDESLNSLDSLQGIETGKKVFESIYGKGIIDKSGLGNLAVIDIINLKSNNEVEAVNIGDLFDIPGAIQEVNGILYPFGLNPFVSESVSISIKKNLVPNIFYDSVTTNQIKRDAISQISLYRGAVQQDEIIIRYGELITQEKFQMLASLKEYTEGQDSERNRLLITLGYFLLTALWLSIFGFFVYNFAPDVFRSTRKLLFILVMIVGMIYIVSWAFVAQIPSYYVIPFCIIPIVLRTFFGTRLSLNAHLIVVLLASFFIPLGIEYTMLNIVAGMVAIFTNIKVHYWSHFFISIGWIFLTYCIGFLGISLIQEGNLVNLQWIDFGWLAINVFLTLMAYPLIPIFEKLFGNVSEITLMELGGLDKKLLKELQIKAPGTFQHSLQVSNLAEAAASEIGANSLLVKVGCLYHDIGKMENSVYFIENQSSNYNPHDELPFEESASIIINHVAKGVEMAKKQNLPEILIDFIRTHHGDTRVEYFYRSYIKSYPDSEVDESLFRYPGPLPYSKETAVVMMADTVEAAAKSLKNPTADSLDKLVDSLIQSKIEHDQFINSTITFKDISTVKKVFKKMLHSIYHVRIEYPE